jgi:hypothetical protein
LCVGAFSPVLIHFGMSEVVSLIAASHKYGTGGGSDRVVGCLQISS